ncbi:major facilitator superfamily domain-containing protein [Penicillium lagena]|uniref:major facilitator superfamily domain-containing protein n=1 Tax=Penicillium lagena TaxID=94218 RepID=UPI0025424E70|nr:major facilitator superfamily domain-containing protein [Penicillium lagena]KAJ5605357.1 major facilitator superfamily domain-containing protein [Penicillium lagena]
MASVHPTDRESNENVSTWKAVSKWLPFPFGDHPWWIDGTTRVPDEKEDNPRLRRAGVINIFDHNGFDFQVFIVAASGFLTDSYALFATNVILPILAFLYWPDQTNRQPELYINVATLAGSAFGQLLFGWLTDRLGRRKLYGLELALVVFATLGMAQASTGMYNNMHILSWIVFYRFFLGIGIGAEYPLSAVITAEFASTKYRSKMMAAVFLMQPLGQLLAAAVGWGVMAGLMRSRGLQGLPDHGPAFEKLPLEQKQLILSTLDSVWRYIDLLIIARFLLLCTWNQLFTPHSALWASHVANVTTFTTLPAAATSITIPITQAVTANGSIYNLTTSGVADFPPVTATLTTVAPATYSGLNVPDYLNIWDPTYNMLDEISNNARYYIYTISIGSLVGGGLLIFLIDYIPRKTWLVCSFLLLSVLFAVLGGVLVATEFRPGHWATVVLYASCQLLFNLGEFGSNLSLRYSRVLTRAHTGPNTLTYIVSVPSAFALNKL